MHRFGTACARRARSRPRGELDRHEVMATGPQFSLHSLFALSHHRTKLIG
jgi:hypothetical protein